MLSAVERNKQVLPVGELGIIALNSCETLGKKVDAYIADWRKKRSHEMRETPQLRNYIKDSYLVDAEVPRFGSGEAKGQINDTVRGDDIYILVDVCNHSITYPMSGIINHMSPDDHFQDLKRIIAAVGEKPAD